MTESPALLIDARNVLYRSAYALLADHRPGLKYHIFTILLRQIASWINAYHPSSVHVFWDAPRETVWRRAALPTYKDRSTSNYVDGLSEHLAIGTAVAKDLFKHMNVRQYDRKQMEADDLLYVAVSLLHPRRSVIVSTDSDMTQIPYRFSSCSVYDPKESKEVSVPVINPAHLKAVVGDDADSIKGYFGIGPAKGKALLEDAASLQKYLAANGARTYHLNLLLIDLSMCPRLLANTVYVQRIMAKPVSFAKDEINRLIMANKINGLQQEFMNLVMPFKNLT